MSVTPSSSASSSILICLFDEGRGLEKHRNKAAWPPRPSAAQSTLMDTQSHSLFIRGIDDGNSAHADTALSMTKGNKREKDPNEKGRIVCPCCEQSPRVQAQRGTVVAKMLIPSLAAARHHTGDRPSIRSRPSLAHSSGRRSSNFSGSIQLSLSLSSLV